MFDTKFKHAKNAKAKGSTDDELLGVSFELLVKREQRSVVESVKVFQVCLITGLERQ